MEHLIWNKEFLQGAIKMVTEESVVTMAVMTFLDYNYGALFCLSQCTVYCVRSHMYSYTIIFVGNRKGSQFEVFFTNQCWI